MKRGERVIVKIDPFIDRHYVYYGKKKPSFKAGIVEFMSARWATVMLLSDTDESPLYRQSFWKEDIYRERKDDK